MTDDQRVAEHGGLRSVHVIPVEDGWANRAVCNDGYRFWLNDAVPVRTIQPAHESENVTVEQAEGVWRNLNRQ